MDSRIPNSHKPRTRLAFRGLEAGFTSLGQLPRLLLEAWPAFLDLAWGLYSRICDLLDHRRRPRSSDCCIYVPNTEYKRPDPLIYDQQYLMKQGLSVVWDNPDIQLFHNGTPVSSNDLQPDTEYEVQVTVWNGSYDAPAIGLPVHLSYLSFGVGTPSRAVGTTYVDLGVKGSAQHPAIAHFTWTTPKAPGHYCLQARLDWADDANPDNNLGQENTNVGVAHSPVEFAFTVRNDAGSVRHFKLVADLYQLPRPTPCAREEGQPARYEDDRGRRRGRVTPGRLTESRDRWRQALAMQAYGRFPVAAPWKVEIEPSVFALDAFADREVVVRIEPTDPRVHGRQPFNVNVFAIDGRGNRSLHGGVTLVVEKA